MKFDAFMKRMEELREQVQGNVDVVVNIDGRTWLFEGASAEIQNVNPPQEKLGRLCWESKAEGNTRKVIAIY